MKYPPYSKIYPGKGHSLTEYVLPLGLLVSCLAVVLSDSSFQANLGHWFLQTFKGTQLSNRVVNLSPLGALSPPAMASSLPPPSNPNQEQICFIKSGNCLTIPVVNSTTAEAVDTSGGLGGEQVLAFSTILDSLPALLKKANVSPAVIDMVTKLANEGHTIGSQFQAIQSVCSVGNSCQGNAQSQVLSLLSTLQNVNKPSFANNWNALNSYFAQNPTALNNFPEAKGIINQQVNNILSMLSGLDYSHETQTIYKKTPIQAAPAPSPTLPA